MEFALQTDPLKVTTFSNKCYFGVNLMITSNPNGDEIAACIPSQALLKKYCVDRVYGAGINCAFVTGESHQFKFVEFFENDEYIQLWHTPKTTHVGHIHRVLTNVSSAQSLVPTTLLLLRRAFF